MTPASLKRAQQAHEVNEEIRREALKEKNKQFHQRRRDAEDARLLRSVLPDLD